MHWLQQHSSREWLSGRRDATVAAESVSVALLGLAAHPELGQTSRSRAKRKGRPATEKHGAQSIEVALGGRSSQPPTAPTADVSFLATAPPSLSPCGDRPLPIATRRTATATASPTYSTVACPCSSLARFLRFTISLHIVEWPVNPDVGQTVKTKSLRGCDKRNDFVNHNVVRHKLKALSKPRLQVEDR